MDALKHIGVQRWRLKPGFAAPLSDANVVEKDLEEGLGTDSAEAPAKDAVENATNVAADVLGDSATKSAATKSPATAASSAVESATPNDGMEAALRQTSDLSDDLANDSTIALTIAQAPQAVDAGLPILENAEQTLAPLSPLPPLAPQMSDEPAPLQDIDWAGLQQLVGDWKHCPSCSASNSILGLGDTQASWLFVADAPSRVELDAGQIFVGRAGKLFDAMLNALQLKREKVYCTSVFKCAATENLNESPQCDDLLQHQIKLIKPDVVVTFGEFAAQKVIKANGSLATLRESTQQCYVSNVVIVPTYSPSQMLDDPSLKALVWQDLKRARALTG